MKYSAKFILALFNKSKSGKSWIYVDGDKMFVLSDTVYQMVKSGEIAEVEFADGEDLKNEDGSVAFHTAKVKDWTESTRAKLARVAAEVEAVEAFDQARYDAAKAKLASLTI